VGTKTITMYVSDIDQSEIPAGKLYQLHNMGKTLKKRGRKSGSTTKATRAASTPPTRRRRQSTKRPATA
jgi:hypothetical protein